MTKQTFIHTCPGNSSLARVADGIAEEVEKFEAVGRIIGDKEASLEQAREAIARGDTVVSINGCESGCSLRMFADAGLGGIQTIQLDELSGDTGTDVSAARLVRQVLDVLGLHDGSDSHEPITVPARKAHTQEDYLRAIWLLASPDGSTGNSDDSQEVVVHAADVARRLNVSRPTAGEAITRLIQSGHLDRGARKELLLTEGGREIAETVIRTHRIVETFLVDVVGCAPSDVYQQATALCSRADDDLIQRFGSLINDADRCPHGWPFDPQQDRVERRTLVGLTSVPEGASVRVERTPGAAVALLCLLAEYGIHPGVDLRVEHNDVAGERVAVCVGNAAAAVTLRHVEADLVLVHAAAN